jgi:hypothetical protein
MEADSSGVDAVLGDRSARPVPRRRDVRSGRAPRAAVAAWLIAMTLRPAPAPATVAEQRARLPPAAECEDPIAGTWRGLSYYPGHRQWYEFTLEIARDAAKPGELRGTILAHYWDGPPDRSEPLPCKDGVSQATIRQQARGTYDDGRVWFGGIRWEVASVACGSHGGRYITDQFKGVVDRERQEFQSINDWSERPDDEATLFRRIRCADAAAPAVTPPSPAPAPGPVSPPPAQPPSRSGGC